MKSSHVSTLGRFSEKIQNITTKVKSCLGKDGYFNCKKNPLLAQKLVIIECIEIVFLKCPHIKNMNAFTLFKSRVDVTVTCITFQITESPFHPLEKLYTKIASVGRWKH